MSNVLLTKVIEEILIKYEYLCVKHRSKESYQEILIEETLIKNQSLRVKCPYEESYLMDFDQKIL